MEYLLNFVFFSCHFFPKLTVFRKASKHEISRHKSKNTKALYEGFCTQVSTKNTRLINNNKNVIRICACWDIIPPDLSLELQIPPSYHSFFSLSLMQMIKLCILVYCELVVFVQAKVAIKDDALSWKSFALWSPWIEDCKTFW